MFLNCKHSQHKCVKRNLMARKQVTTTEYCIWIPRFPINPRTLICHVINMTISPSLFTVRGDSGRQGVRLRMFLFWAPLKASDAVSCQTSTFSLLEIFHNYSNTIIRTSENHKLDRSWMCFRALLCREMEQLSLDMWYADYLSSIPVIKSESLIFMSKTWSAHSLITVFTPKNKFF